MEEHCIKMELQKAFMSDTSVNAQSIVKNGCEAFSDHKREEF